MRIHGKNGKVTIATSSDISEVTDWTLDTDVSADDASFMKSGNSRNALPGQYGGTIGVTCNYDPTDTAGQEALVTAHLTGALVNYKLQEEGTTVAKKYWSGAGFVTKLGEKGSVGSKITRDFTITIDGDLTRN